MISGNFLEISNLVWIRIPGVPTLILTPGVPQVRRTDSARNPIRDFLNKKKTPKSLSFLHLISVNQSKVLSSAHFNSE
jgi:hypothetical protein